MTHREGGRAPSAGCIWAHGCLDSVPGPSPPAPWWTSASRPDSVLGAAHQSPSRGVQTKLAEWRLSDGEDLGQTDISGGERSFKVNGRAGAGKSWDGSQVDPKQIRNVGKVIMKASQLVTASWKPARVYVFKKSRSKSPQWQHILQHNYIAKTHTAWSVDVYEWTYLLIELILKYFPWLCFTSPRKS